MVSVHDLRGGSRTQGLRRRRKFLSEKNWDGCGWGRRTKVKRKVSPTGEESVVLGEYLGWCPRSLTWRGEWQRVNY